MAKEEGKIPPHINSSSNNDGKNISKVNSNMTRNNNNMKNDNKVNNNKTRNNNEEHEE